MIEDVRLLKLVIPAKAGTHDKSLCTRPLDNLEHVVSACLRSIPVCGTIGSSITILGDQMRFSNSKTARYRRIDRQRAKETRARELKELLARIEPEDIRKIMSAKSKYIAAIDFFMRRGIGRQQAAYKARVLLGMRELPEPRITEGGAVRPK